MKNAQVLAALPDDQKTGTGTYTGNWRVVGTNYGKLKLVSDGIVAIQRLGLTDPDAVKAKPITGDETTEEEGFRRASWSSTNGVENIKFKSSDWYRYIKC